MTQADIVREIMTGKLDDKLDIVAEAISNRRKILRQIKTETVKAQLKVGSKATLSTEIRPEYLGGQTVEVVKVRHTRVVVSLVNPSPNVPRKWRIATFNCPMDLLEVPNA